TDLNDVETDRVGRGEPKPMAAALPVLLSVVADPQMIDAVKVAGLIGILRHAQLGIEDKQIEKQIAVELLKLAGEEVSPDHRSVDGHRWLRSRAIEILSAVYTRQGATAPKEFSAILEAIIADKDYP